MQNWGWIAIPIIIGLIQPVIWQMTIRLAKVFGDMPASVILHLIGTLAGALLIAMGLRGGNGQIESIPWWAWFGGAIGVCSLWLLNMGLPKLGVATFMALLVASQLIAGLVFDGYGLMGTEVRRIQWFHWIGVLFLAVGAYLVSRS